MKNMKLRIVWRLRDGESEGGFRGSAKSMHNNQLERPSAES